MKTLNKDQMNSVSGAGAEVDMMVGMAGYYKTYDNFGDYLSYMNKHHGNALYSAEVTNAYKTWANQNNIDAVASAKINHWNMSFY